MGGSGAEDWAGKGFEFCFDWANYKEAIRPFKGIYKARQGFCILLFWICIGKIVGFKGNKRAHYCPNNYYSYPSFEAERLGAFLGFWLQRGARFSEQCVFIVQ